MVIMASNGSSRSISDNSFGDYAQNIQGDLNISVHPSRKTLDLDYLHEAAFNAANKQHTPTCLENTRVDILRQIRNWINGNAEERLYWLRGMAGTGKTTISLTIAREFYNKNQLGASFFFSRGSGDLASTRKFVATVANQLAESLPLYREHLSTALEYFPSIGGHGLYDQWEKLILEPLRLVDFDNVLYPVLIVIDALDECDSQDDIGLVIECLADVATLENIPFRIFITSRPEQPIYQGFNSIVSDSHQVFTLHNIEESIVGKDLEIYYEHELSNMELDTSVITNDTIQKLVRKSHGLFIHAATVCRFIRQGEMFATARLLDIVASENLQLEAEKELDVIYTTILGKAFEKFVALRRHETESLRLFFHNVVGCVVILFDRMTLTNFAIMLGEPKENIMRLLKHLGSVLDVTEQSSGEINVIHPSFRDFLTVPGRNSNPYFSINSRKMHSHLLQRCLEVMANELRKNMCKLRQPGIRAKDIPRSTVDDKISYVLQYACSYWVYHLQHSDVNPREHCGILEFFQTQFLFWVEALTLIGRLPDSIHMMRLLNSLLSRIHMTTNMKWLLAITELNYDRSSAKVTAQSLSAVVDDAIRFLSTHSSTIEEAPLQLYCSALIFSPTSSVIRCIYLHQIPKWILCVPSVFKFWSPRLSRLYHPEPANTVSFSPDGKLIASGHSGGTVCLWGATTGAQRRTLKGHIQGIVSISFSPNSRLVMSASRDDTIRIWNASTGVEIRTYHRHHRVHSVRFLPDSRRIIFHQPMGHIWSWDIVESKELWISYGVGGYGYEHIAISPDGKFIACVDTTDGSEIWLLDAETGKTLRKVKEFQKGMNVGFITFSPDSNLLAMGMLNEVKICNITTGATRSITIILDSNEIIFSPDGKLIAIATARVIELWDITSGRMRLQFNDHHVPFTGRPGRLAFSPNGSIIASVGELNGVALWDTRFSWKQSTSELGWHVPSVLAVSADDKRLASGSYGDVLRLWDGQTGARVELYVHELRPLMDMLYATLTEFIYGMLMALIFLPVSPFPPTRAMFAPFHRRPKTNNIASIIFSPNNNRLACVWKTKHLQVWDSETGKMLFKQKMPSSLASSVSGDAVFSPDGTLVTSLSSKIHFWDTNTGSEIFTYEPPFGQVESVAFSPNGKFLISSIATDCTLIGPYVSDCGVMYGYIHISIFVETGSLLQFSSNSNLLAYRFKEKIILLDVEKRKIVHTISGVLHIQKLAFLHDSTLLAVSSESAIQIYEVVTGKTIHQVDLYEKGQTLCFSLNGIHIASLDKALALRSSESANCHSHGISIGGGWVKDDGQDIIYFPQDYRDSLDFMGGSALVFFWPPTNLLREVVQHLGCNMLQLDMGDKVMDED